jgi:hypothetical protein
VVDCIAPQAGAGGERVLGKDDRFHGAQGSRRRHLVTAVVTISTPHRTTLGLDP